MTLPWAKPVFRTHLGELLSAARVRNQVSLDLLAATTGLHKGNVCRLLNHTCPKLSTALALGRALGVQDCRIVQAWARDRVAAEGLSLNVVVEG